MTLRRNPGQRLNYVHCLEWISRLSSMKDEEEEKGNDEEGEHLPESRDPTLSSSSDRSPGKRKRGTLSLP